MAQKITCLPVQTRHIEIAKVFSEDEHASIPDFLVISTKTWNKLTPEQQQILETAAKKSEAYQQKLWEKLTLTHVLRRKLWVVKSLRLIKPHSVPQFNLCLTTSKRSKTSCFVREIR